MLPNTSYIVSFVYRIMFAEICSWAN